jgi:hypothetical protein
MKFSDLKPGDVITIRQGGKYGETYRAMVREHRGDYVVVVLWNAVAQRWNTHSGRVTAARVVRYPRDAS